MNSDDVKINKLTEFEHDLKKLSKFRNLENDIYRAVNAIIVELPKMFHGSVKINNCGPLKNPVFKLRKFRSTDLKGKGCRSGFRLIYAYDEQSLVLTLIEIYYHKSESSNYDKKRVLDNFNC